MKKKEVGEIKLPPMFKNFKLRIEMVDGNGKVIARSSPKKKPTK